MFANNAMWFYLSDGEFYQLSDGVKSDSLTATAEKLLNVASVNDGTSENCGFWACLKFC